jgi:hypothetical protein
MSESEVPLYDFILTWHTDQNVQVSSTDTRMFQRRDTKEDQQRARHIFPPLHRGVELRQFSHLSLLLT